MLSLFIALSPMAQPLRHAVFDSYQRVFPLERTAPHVAVVLIDENAIARYGQWPWPRTRVAELIEAISRQQPLAIALDLIFPEADRFSPAILAREIPQLTAPVARALAALPSNDQRLADAIRGKYVVLGISAERQADPRFPAAPAAYPVRQVGAALDAMEKFPGHIGNIAVVDAAAASRGTMNAGPQDQVIRMVPLVQNVQGAIVPSLGVEALRAAAEKGITLSKLGNGLMRLQFESIDVRLQDDGNTWLRFHRYDPGSTIPAANVMTGEANPESFKDKIVLVGISGLGVLDYKTTALGEFIPGVNVHAQVAENLLNGVSLVRPEAAVWVEALALFACGLALIWFVPRMSALQGINLALALVAVLAAIGVISFLHFNLLFDPAWPALGTAAVFGSVVVGTLSEADRQRRQLREQAAHMAGEVDAARRIQMGLLPDPRETLSGDRRFDLAALLEPARTVGGDFYDCFMVDARRLFIVVADVSGKGLAAALFMASVKSHLKSAVLRGGSVGEVLMRAQEEIGRENPEQLFVTAFAALLDVQTGLFEYANAGHEPPFARLPHGAPERVGVSGGPPLCVVEEFAYPTERRQMAPGEWMVLVTDGATEAMNPAREFYGVERLRASLSWAPQGVRPRELIDKLRSELAKFANGAEAADDVTLMALRWDGPGPAGIKILDA
ncbi:MAG TPA: CHASE2 domain-containing protein [Usitatibacter sp.]|nr:CHASE2 domain-containing protein [Usitatibacter sp.]